MKYDPFKHRRRSIRLKGYDYAQAGAYYVTMVTGNRENFFGKIVNGEMRLSEIGKIATQCWLAIPQHHANADLDEFVVMPNHVHGIIVISDDGDRRAGRRGVQLNARTTAPTAPTANGPTRDPANQFSMMSPHRRTLSVIVRTYKAAVTTACRDIQRHDFAWQRNYYEHIVRDERDLDRIRTYIANNPFKWQSDDENPHDARQR